MQGACAWTVRVSALLLLLRSDSLDSQQTTDHRKVPQRAEAPQELRAEHRGTQGSWGTWGPWSACSRTCGSGVQEQTRPCLPAHTPTRYPSRGGGGIQPEQPGRVISALRPSVPLHRDPVRPSNSSGRGEPWRERESRPGGRRRGSHIIPGRYGYGRAPYVAPLQTDGGRGSETRRPHRQRRSAAASYHHPSARGHAGHGTNGPDASDGRRRYGRPYAQPGAQQHRNNQVWAPLYQPTSANQAQVQQETQWGTQTSGGPQQHQERPYDPLPASSCTGEHVRHRICSSNACPASSRHIRADQCSSFNNQPFMGRIYQWEPFNEVPGEQHCELHCRAVGFRFYVRQSERVIDGTPCGQNESSLCVAGRCVSLGCDEYLGSGKEIDKCGVCGGDNSTCKLVSGLFRHSHSKIGYHMILEIPEGATKINVTEMAKSRNYLALRSRSGRSIINGNWVIDRPGKYEGAGTMFTYRRPNEIRSTAGESFLAEGPTNEILDVFMIFQQPNPGVHYEYILPSERQPGPQHPNHREEANAVNGQGGYGQRIDSQQENPNPGGGRYPSRLPDNQVPVAQPPRREREHNWKQSGFTECSASCGKGFRYSVFTCVHRQNHVQVSDALCDSGTRPSPQEEACNLQPCPAFWDIGEWSECSKTCGLGMQHRQVLCRQVYANRTLNVHTSRCQHLERPETTSTCQLKICSEWQIRSEWTACSVPCGLGQRSREVRCVSNVGDFVPDEECNMNLRPNDVENCDMGACAKSWFYTEWGNRCSAECGMGVRTRGVLCLNNHISSLPLEGCGSERPADSQVCNNGPCENRIEWFTGPWSQCSAECGPGSQQRSVVCLMKSDEGFTVMPLYECSSLERPLGQQSCNLKACGAKWYHTDWSVCSKTCEGGFRVREVRCLSDDMLSSEACGEQPRPAEKETCNPEPCIPHIDENCRDKYFNCNVVVQARLCVYEYYKTTCCASCSRVAHRQPIYRGRS